MTCVDGRNGVIRVNGSTALTRTEADLSRRLFWKWNQVAVLERRVKIIIMKADYVLQGWKIWICKVPQLVKQKQRGQDTQVKLKRALLNVRGGGSRYRWARCKVSQLNNDTIYFKFVSVTVYCECHWVIIIYTFSPIKYNSFTFCFVYLWKEVKHCQEQQNKVTAWIHFLDV